MHLQGPFLLLIWFPAQERQQVDGFKAPGYRVSGGLEENRKHDSPKHMFRRFLPVASLLKVAPDGYLKEVEGLQCKSMHNTITTIALTPFTKRVDVSRISRLTYLDCTR